MWMWRSLARPCFSPGIPGCEQYVQTTGLCSAPNQLFKHTLSSWTFQIVFQCLTGTRNHTLMQQAALKCKSCNWSRCCCRGAGDGVFLNVLYSLPALQHLLCINGRSAVSSYNRGIVIIWSQSKYALAQSPPAWSSLAQWARALEWPV